MKKTVLVSSILTIVLCVSIIAGSTFALFTSQDDVNIAVTAGQVKMDAAIELVQLESVKGDPAGTIVDENGNTYIYEVVSPNFTNGGTAAVTSSLIELTEVTPGDKATFKITGANTSNVAIQYRYVITCEEGEELMKGLKFYVNDVEVNDYMESYTSPWYALATGNDIAPVKIAVELPVDKGNEFQNKSTTIKVLVEAVQGNAVVEDNANPVITYYSTAATKAELAEILADPYLPIVDITESITDELVLSGISNKTINVNNNDVKFKVTGNVENVVITGINDTADAAPSILVDSGASGTLTVLDSTLGTTDAGRPYGAIAGQGSTDLDLVVDNCTFVSNNGNKSGVYFTGLGSVTVTNSTFIDCSSWAVMVNGKVLGDVVIDNCKFYGCTGIVKAAVSGAVEGDLVITNCYFEDCELKNSVWADVDPVMGDITVENNEMYEHDASNNLVLVDDNMDAADMLGIKAANP